jgi:hypothetical protein
MTRPNNITMNAFPFINTSFQGAECATKAKTVSTVSEFLSSFFTRLKSGVNENGNKVGWASRLPGERASASILFASLRSARTGETPALLF